jgi:hypothetical protein
VGSRDAKFRLETETSARIGGCLNRSPRHGIEIEGYRPEDVGHHSYLLMDAGLAAGTDIGTMHGCLPDWRLSHLTWAGHDFADASRDDSRWAKATAVVKERAGTVTFDVLKQVLASLIKSTLGI